MNTKKLFSASYCIIILLLGISFIMLYTENHRDLADTKKAIHSQAKTIWRENGKYTFSTSKNTYIITDESKKELIDNFIKRENSRGYFLILIVVSTPLISLSMYSLYMRACVYQNRLQRKKAEAAQQKAYWEALTAQQKAQVAQAEAEKKAIVEARQNLVIFDWSVEQ